MKNIKRLLLLPLLCLTFQNCVKDAELYEGTEISVPEKLTTMINLYKVIDSTGESNNITVSFLDNKSSYLAIKNGSVKINGMAMELKHRIVAINRNYYYYSAKNSIDKINLHTLYEFEITLSDGQVYRSSIVTQNLDLYELNLPVVQPIATSMPISWKDADTINEIMLYLTIKYMKNNDSTCYVFGTNETNKRNGNYVFQEKYINSSWLATANRAQVAVVSSKNGMIDSRFALNSEIVSTYKIVKVSPMK